MPISQSTSTDCHGEPQRDPTAEDVASPSQQPLDDELTAAPWIGLHYRSETR